MRRFFAGAALSVAMIVSGVTNAQAQAIEDVLAQIPGGTVLYATVQAQCLPVPLVGCEEALRALLLAAADSGVSIAVLVAALEAEFAGNAAALAALDLAVEGTGAGDDGEDASPS